MSKEGVLEMCKLEGSMIKILFVCTSVAVPDKLEDENVNVIFNNKIFKQEVRDSGIDLSDVGIDSYISKLCKMNFLIKKCRGMYVLNPRFFFKGTLNDAAKMQYVISNK